MSNYTTKRLSKYSEQAKVMYTNADHWFEWEQQEGSMETLIEEFHREYLEDYVAIGYFRNYLYQYFIRISEVDNIYMAREYMEANGFWESIEFKEVWEYLEIVDVNALIKDIRLEVSIYQDMLGVVRKCNDFFQKVYDLCGYTLLSDADLQEFGVEVWELEADRDALRNECEDYGLDFHKLSCDFAYTKSEYKQLNFEQPQPQKQQTESLPYASEIMEAVAKVEDVSVRIEILTALSNFFITQFNFNNTKQH